ncbi:hypothetical protein [uncultured Sphingomonas sp.]|uniref:hypothetical protein n=1 Tax=uncultured Sphingomonas sp. TaxID=158754 RepID=UPI0035CA5C3E
MALFGKISVAMATFLILVIVGLSPSGAHASSYSCGTSGGGVHCYGQVRWTDASEIFAASTVVWPLKLQCNGCDGFVDDEMWLADMNSPKCRTNQFGACWVEVGFIRGTGRKNTDFFWADVRPGHGFSFHWLGAINGVTDDLQFLIVKDTSQGANSTSFYVVVAQANLNAVVLHSGKSTKNSMIATTQTIGQELAGSKGSAADAELFRLSQVSLSSNQFAAPGALVNRSTSGVVSNDNPPLGGWLFFPANVSGGGFVTACCEKQIPVPSPNNGPAPRPLSLERVKSLAERGPDAAGTAALQGPFTSAERSRSQIAAFLASQTMLGRIDVRGARLGRVELLSARAASDRLDALDLGLPGATPVLLAEVAGRFAMSGPRGTRIATFSKAELVFDARTGNLVTLMVPEN